MAEDLSGHAGADSVDAGFAGEEELAGQCKTSKRRLTAKEVRVLEHNFVTQGPRLEQETKLRLARELSLQPRQVAIWFQNRRARWKGKQLEKDFLLLKAEYLAFKAKYNALLDEKQKLAEEVKRLKEVESDKSPEWKDNLMPELPPYNLNVDDFPALDLGPAYPELGISDLDIISTSHLDSSRAASTSSSCCRRAPSNNSIGLLGPDSGQTSQPCCCRSLFESMNVMNLLASPPHNGAENCSTPKDDERDPMSSPIMEWILNGPSASPHHNLQRSNRVVKNCVNLYDDSRPLSPRARASVPAGAALLHAAFR